MSEPPPALDVILASIRARVMEPGNDDNEDSPPPVPALLQVPVLRQLFDGGPERHTAHAQLGA